MLMEIASCQSLGNVGQRGRCACDDFCRIESRHLSASLEDAAIDDHRIDVRWLSRLDEHVRRIGEYAHVEAVSADENQIAAFAGRQRASDMIDSQGAGAMDRAEFKRASRREFEFVESLRIFGVSKQFQNTEQMSVARERRSID